MKWTMAVVLAGLVVAPVAAQDDGLSYNYIEVTYVDVSIDQGPDGDGLGLGLSFKVHPQIHLFGNYEDVSFDRISMPPIGVIDLEGEAFDLGVGWNGGLGDRADFVAQAAYVDVELSGGGFTASDDGYGLRAGIRGLVADRVELDGFVTYVDLSDSGDDTAFSAAIYFNATSRFSVGAGYEVADDDDTLHAGIRIHWGGNN